MVEIFTKDFTIQTHTYRGSVLNKKCSFTHPSCCQGQQSACLLHWGASVFMNVEEFGYFIEIFMLLTVLNDLRERGTVGHWLALCAPGQPAQWGGLGQRPHRPGSCGNSPLLTPNECMPTPWPPSQVLTKNEMLPSQGYTFVLLRHGLTQVDNAQQGTR